MSKGVPGYMAVLLLALVMLGPYWQITQGRSYAAETDLQESLSNGYVLFEAGRLDEALEIFEQVAVAQPGSVEALRAVGVTCYRLDLYDQGAEAFKALIALAPDSARTHSRLGFVYSQMNRQMEAIEAHSRAIALDPALVPAHWGKGLAYKQLGYYEEAAKSFREVTRRSPDFAEAHFDLAEVCLNMNDRCTAIDEYKILRKLDKELADRLFDLIYK